MPQSLAELINAGLDKPALSLIAGIGKAGRSRKQGIYLVGGIVRDLLLGRPGRDIDITVEGSAVELAQSLSKSVKSRPVIHTRFGTATFKINGYSIDLATCRGETYAYPGALPRVFPADLKADLKRRDFSVNAMAAGIEPARFGELIDYYGGKKDLDKGLVRILHNRSFQDDATRIMRALRYEQRLGFRLEPGTERTLLRDLDMLDTISGDRLRRELMLWLGEQQPEKILRRAFGLGVLAKLHGALTWNTALEKAFASARSLARSLSLAHLYFALLIYCLEDRQLGQLLKRLNMTGGELYKSAMQTLALKSELDGLNKAGLKPSEIYFLLSPYSLTAVRANMLLAAPVAGKNLGLYLDKLRLVRASLNGKDLEAMGIPPGRRMGSLLRSLLAARLDGKVRSRRDEIRLASHLKKG